MGLSPPLSPQHLPPTHTSAPMPHSTLQTDIPLRRERARERTASAVPRQLLASLCPEAPCSLGPLPMSTPALRAA